MPLYTVLPDGSGRSQGEKYTLLASQRLGLKTDSLHTYFTDFTLSSQDTNALSGVASGIINGWLINGGGSVAAAVSTTDLGGVLKLTTGTSASSSTNAYGPVILDRADTGVGYVAARLRFPAGMDVQGQSLLAVAVSNVSHFGVGQQGSLSTTNFVFAYDLQGTPKQVSIAAYDTNFHIYEFWYGLGDGKYHVAFDGAEVGTGVTPSSATSNVPQPWLRLSNGSTAAARQLDADFVFFAGTFTT